MKKIGFNSYDNEENEEQKKQQEQQTANKAIADFLSANYSPIGCSSEKVYKTTEELVYDLDNIISIGYKELAKQLVDAGYRVEYLAGQPYWVMYEKR